MKITIESNITLSPSARRGIRWVLLPVAVFAGTATFAHAYDTSWVRSGQPVSSSQLASNLNEIQARLVGLEANRTEWARVTGSCVIESQSGAWTTAMSTGAGDCSLNFTTGHFSQAPSCVVVSNGSNGAFPRYLYSARVNDLNGLGFPSAAGARVKHMTIDTDHGGSPAPAAEAFTIVCTGRR